MQSRSDFAGSVIGTVASANECDDPLATGTCSDHFLTTANAGLVETRIDWPIALDPLLESDLDLFVFECRDIFDPLLGMSTRICDQQVAVSQRDRGNFEYVRYQADAGDEFRIVVVPAFVLVQQDYQGCNAYVDGAVNCPDPEPEQQEPEPAGDFLAGCEPDTTTASHRAITGGGHVDDPSGHPIEHFMVNVRETPQTNFDAEGKVQWNSDPLKRRFSSTDVTCAAYQDEGEQGGTQPDDKQEGSAHVRGVGNLTQRQPDGSMTTIKVCFDSLWDDNGEPGGTRFGGSDNFTISFRPFSPGDPNVQGDETCGPAPAAGETHGGVIGGGNIQYHATREA